MSRTGSPNAQDSWLLRVSSEQSLGQHCLQDQGGHVLPQPTDRCQRVEFVGLALLTEAP